MHRFVLPENNTHRAKSKNSASSRAIPVGKQLERILNDPAWPLVWGSEMKGMQSGPPLEDHALREAKRLFEDVWAYTTNRVTRYLAENPLQSENPIDFVEARLHKSLINRLLEPFMWHKVIVSATDAGWTNFFKLRSTHFTDKAMPEMAAFADACYEAYMASTPTRMEYGEWHTPYIREDDDFALFGDPIEARKMVSVGRTCRVSYLTHDGIRDMNEDIRLFGRLATERPIHASPLEHVATPSPEMFTRGNFDGWLQFRHQVEDELEVENISAEAYIKRCLTPIESK